MLLTLVAAKKKTCKDRAQYFQDHNCGEGMCDFTGTAKCQNNIKILVEECKFAVDCDEGSNIFDILGDAANNILDGAGNILEETGDIIGDILGDIGDTAGDIIDGIGDVGGDILDGAGDIIDGLFG